MEFGMFYELFSRAPHDTASIKQAYDEAIEQIKLAERSGFGYVWAVEHHFQTLGSKSAAPELFLTAIARETSTIRLGHGVVLLTMNHPVRVAERAAILDLLSDGRLEFGTGRGTTDSELGGFNVTPEDSRPMWEESVRLLPKLWTEEEVEHNGKYWSFPARSIVPKPLQKSHPPMWVSGVSLRTFELAGEMGLGILSFSLSAPGQSEAAIHGVSPTHRLGRAGRQVREQQGRGVHHRLLPRGQAAGARGGGDGLRFLLDRHGEPRGAVQRRRHRRLVEVGRPPVLQRGRHVA